MKFVSYLSHSSIFNGEKEEKKRDKRHSATYFGEKGGEGVGGGRGVSLGSTTLSVIAHPLVIT